MSTNSEKTNFGRNKKKTSVKPKVISLSILSNEALFNQLNDAILIVDKNFSITSVNSKTEKIFGKKKSLLINKNVSRFLIVGGNSKNQDVTNILKKIFASGKKSKEFKFKDCKITLSKNKFQSVNCSMTAIKNDSGKTEYAAIVLSVKEEKGSDKNKSSDFNFEFPGFIYRCANDKNWTMKFITDGCTSITGYRPADLIENKKISYNNIIHPDYRKLVSDKWKKVLKEKEYFEFEYPIISRKKELKWVWERGKGIFSEEGKVLYLEGFITDITERKNTETMLLLKNIVFESAISANSIADIKGRITNLNAAFLNLWGYKSKSEIINKHLSNFLINKKTANDILKILNKNGRWEGEFNALKKDGSSFLAYGMATLIHDSNGKKIGFQSSILDITEKKEIEYEAELNRDRMQLLVEGTPHLFFYVQDKNGYIEYISPSVEDITGYKVSDWLNQRDWFATESAVNQIAKARTHKHLAGKIDTSPIYVEIKHANNETVQLEVYERPIFKEGKVVGLRGVAHDITQKLKSEERLRLSESSYRSIIDSITESIYIQDENGVFVDVNEGAVAMYGYDKQTLIGKTPEFVSAPNRNDLAANRITVNKAFAGEKQQLEFWGKRKNGEEFLKDVRLYPGTYFNKKVVIAVASDITERKKSEKLLQESEEKYRTLAENVNDVLYLIDRNGRFSYISSGVKNILGYDANDLIGKRLIDFIYPEDTKLMPQQLRKIITNTVEPTDYRLISKSGSVHWVRSSGKAVYDNGRVTGFLGVMIDINKEKNFEQRIKLSEERYRIISSLTSDYLFSTLVDKDGNHRIEWAAGSFEKITGYTLEEYREAGGWRATLPPDELIKDDHDIERLKHRLKVDREVKTYHKDGSVVWVRTYAQPLWDEKTNTLKGVYGAVQDITRQKKSEESIRMMAHMLDIAPNAISVYSFDGKCLYANQNAAKMHGYTVKEYKRLNFSDIDTPENSTMLAAQINLINTIGEARFEVTHYRKDKTEIPLEIYAKKVEWAGIPALLSIGTDITERKKAINELKAERDLFSSGPVSIIIWSPSEDWPVKYVSSNIVEILGYTSEFLTDPKFKYTSLLHPDDLKDFQNEINYYLENSIDTYEQSYRLRHKDDYYLWIYDYTKFVRDNNGNLSEIKGYLFDQTNLKNAQNEIEDQKQRLSNIIIGTNVGTWEWNIQSGEAIFNERWAEIGGYTLKELEPLSIKTWLKLIHPEDLVKSEELLKKHFKGKSEYFECEVRIKHREGHWVWTLDKGKVISRTPDNKALMMFGTHQDITERKRAEILEHIQYKVADAAVSSLKLTDLFESIRFELSTIMNVNNFFIALFDEKTGMLQSDVDRDEKEEIPYWAAKGSMTGYVIEQKKSILVNKKQINQLMENGIAGMIGTIPEIWLGVPFRIGGKVIGVLVVQSYDNPNAYDQNSVEILEIVAHELSIFIQHKRAEEESQKLTKAIIQSPASILITDPNGVIEYVNPKFTEISGYSLEEVKGKTPNIVQSDEHDKRFFAHLWKTISSGKDWHGEIKNRKKNGDFYWETSIISPILNEEGKITNYLAINEDITEKKKMIEELIIAKEKAEEMNRVKSSFFANMSHELRTPMVGILGFSEMLMDEFKNNPDFLTMIKSINTSGHRLLETLNMILNISKLEAAKVEPVLSTTNIIPIIRESFQFFESAAFKKNLNYALNIAVDEVLCSVDSFLFLSIMNNLINNAIKFTSYGSITVTVETLNNDVSISVSDSGVGISREKLNLIWEEFRQASEGYNRSFEGTGLGLTISKRYTELMNGKIYVESVIDKGTTFTITFPLIEGKLEKTSVDTTHNIPNLQKINGNFPKILYVEDDDVSIKLVKTITKGLYEVDTAKDSDEALSLVNNNKYKLILMDINLHKGMDGIELTQLLRKNADYKDIPIVALTAFAMGQEKNEFLSKGMTHYLSKPFSRMQLLEIINEAIKGKNISDK
ncbi:MAG: PAS domain S-box protein [Ignavibacteriaceae bacterium]|jgi:PAS domain S-box-containing protein|nr:PAS domain S-box protein [Ignavibacteriaceae bacterium]